MFHYITRVTRVEKEPPGRFLYSNNLKIVSSPRKKKSQSDGAVAASFIHPFQWPTTVSSNPCVCVCVVGVHTRACSCVASWQNVGHGAAAAAWHALTWDWPKSHSLQYHGWCASSLSLSRSFGHKTTKSHCKYFPRFLFSYMLRNLSFMILILLLYFLTILLHSQTLLFGILIPSSNLYT